MDNFLPEFGRDVPAPSISQSDNDGRIGSIRTQHDAMVDALIANPTLTNAELAIMFNRTQAWTSYVTNSDLFRARLAERRKEIVDPVLQMTVQQRMEAVTAVSLDVLMNKLVTKPDAALALKTVEILTKSQGYGARTEINVNANAGAVSSSGATRPQLSKEEWLKEFGNKEMVESNDTL